MKKIKIITTIVILLSSLTSCMNANATDTQTSDVTTETLFISTETIDPVTVTSSIDASVQSSETKIITPTEPTNFHGDCLISAAIPSDGMIEKDGKTAPSVLELTITNESNSPLYIEEGFALQKQGDDGEWKDAARFSDETMRFEDRVVAAGETSVIRIGILTEHYELWSGSARVILNVHFYEADPNDQTIIVHETAFYMKAVDFNL